jgi:hypothetical protein
MSKTTRSKKTKKSTARRPRNSGWPYWSRFAPERTVNNGETRRSVAAAHVSLTLSAGTTHREAIIAIAKQIKFPLPIESLSDELDSIKPSRGCTHFGFLGNVLGKIANNYPNMRWWISEKGLNMAVVPPEKMLPSFEAIVAESCAKFWKDSRLSKPDLQLIARDLDERTATMDGNFLDRFPPSAREMIAEFNQKNPRAAIKTFTAAVANPRFARPVRKVLYRARERFAKAKASGF